MLYAGMGFPIISLSIILYRRVQKKTQPGDQNACTRQNEQQKDIGKLRAKRIIITILIIMGVIMMLVCILAAFLTFLEAILPILVVFSIPESAFTPEDTTLFTFNNFFLSSISARYIGSPQFWHIS